MATPVSRRVRVVLRYLPPSHRPSRRLHSALNVRICVSFLSDYPFNTAPLAPVLRVIRVLVPSVTIFTVHSLLSAIHASFLFILSSHH